MLISALLIACTPSGSNGNQDATGGKYAEIAKCLTSKGVKFYGAYWCPHCADQKKIFGSDMQFINYVECDASGKNGKPEECKAAGVERFPTWFFPGQPNVVGVNQPEELAKLANCEIPGSTSTTTTQAPITSETSSTQAATTTQTTQQ